MKNLRVIFAGTPVFAAHALSAVHAAGFAIPLVLTQPDRPANRGMQRLPSPVKQYALTHELPCLQPQSLRKEGRYGDDARAAIATLRNTPHDIMVVAAYGLILPQEVLTIPTYGCLNIHASLLPRWRGAAPIQRAIEAGDAHTGISLMQMDAGLDTGQIISMETLTIDTYDTSAQVHDRLADLGAQMVVSALQTLATGARLHSTPQPETGLCYAEKISKEETQLDFSQPATLLMRRILAFNPNPGARTLIHGQNIKLWQATAHAADHHGTPGTVLAVNEDGIDVACASGVLRLTELQKPGGKRLSARAFLQGFPLAIGDVLEFSAHPPHLQRS
ncbi:MAG: methionyl-tRNA formyltransferase [Ottowia sp.]|nr:methionyl-tRNA formyltransferase [Ottowia sp.]